MRRVGPPLVPFALALLTGCAADVSPADPLIGTWRSDEFCGSYPGTSCEAPTTEEFTFAPDGSVTRTETLRFPTSSPDGRAGCVQVTARRRQWRVRTEAGPPTLVIAAETESDQSVNATRTGCVDAARNRPSYGYYESGLALLPSGGSYTITEPTLTIAWGLGTRGGYPPFPRDYRRVR